MDTIGWPLTSNPIFPRWHIDMLFFLFYGFLCFHLYTFFILVFQKHNAKFSSCSFLVEIFFIHASYCMLIPLHVLSYGCFLLGGLCIYNWFCFLHVILTGVPSVSHAVPRLQHRLCLRGVFPRGRGRRMRGSQQGCFIHRFSAAVEGWTGRGDEGAGGKSFRGHLLRVNKCAGAFVTDTLVYPLCAVHWTYMLWW